METASQLLMIRPVQFGYNPQTAINNHFQRNTADSIQAEALKEFDGLVSLLQKNKIAVWVLNDTLYPQTPDSIFPNNWISFHDDNSMVLYPMFAENRRLERKSTILEPLKKKFRINTIHDLTVYERENRFLEGTGSMVLDRKNKIAYACLSPRTDQSLFELFCRLKGFQPVSFTAHDLHGNPVYHTNVMMCVAQSTAIICLEAISDPNERNSVRDTILSSGKEILTISLSQLNAFAGNMLEVMNEEGEKFMVMSSQAYRSLDEAQLKLIEKNDRMLHAPLAHIETAGGGSARCMMAEIFLTTPG